MKILALDPGSTQSGWAVLDEQYRPLAKGKWDNREILDFVREFSGDLLVVEALQGGPKIGKTVLDTALWSGRFIEAAGCQVWRVPRMRVKMHFLGKAAVKNADGQIARKLLERFDPSAPPYDSQTWRRSGWFCGMTKDAWQAYALGVTFLDLWQADALLEYATQESDGGV